MKLKRTSNIERPTSNIVVGITRKSFTSMFNVQRSMFDVRLDFPRRSRRGFSFAEVMFAVVILGIGFIMVAAVFPVAIHQTQSTGEENTAANAARAAAAAIASLPPTIPNPYNQKWYTTSAAKPADGTAESVETLLLFPPTVKNYVVGSAAGAVPPPSIVVPFVGPRWDLIKANVISSTDPRYSYIPFYRRDNNSAVAELIVIAVANRNQASYASSDVTASAASNTQYTGASTIAVTTVMATPPPQTGDGFTWIYPDTLTLMANPTGTTSLEGSTVTVAINPLPSIYRTFALGREVLNNPTQYELNAPDNVILSPGSGAWGSGGKKWISDDMTKLASSATVTLPTPLQPVVAYATLVSSKTYPAGEITLYADSTGFVVPPAATAGAFIVIADDYPFDPLNSANPNYSLPTNTSTHTKATVAGYSTVPPYQVGSLNGRIFRLGQPVQDQLDPGTGVANGQPAIGTFLLDPSYGMRPGGTFIFPGFPPTPTPVYSPDMFYPTVSPLAVAKDGRVKVYIIGAGKVNGANAGTAQDMGVFATYFQVQ